MSGEPSDYRVETRTLVELSYEIHDQHAREALPSNEGDRLAFSLLLVGAALAERLEIVAYELRQLRQSFPKG